ncbi:hypothetical protein ES705_34830 [subsurface metagenome]
MTQEKAPTKAGVIMGKIPNDKINFLKGISTLATKYPIGTPISKVKKTTEKLITKELRKLL